MKRETRKEIIIWNPNENHNVQKLINKNMKI